MTEKRQVQSNNAIMNQFLFHIGERNKPKTKEEAISLPKEIKEKWRLKGQTLVTSTHNRLMSSCNEAMRLRENGGEEYDILCAMVNELANRPGKKLNANPRFKIIIDSLKRATF